jgi:glutamate racemase
VIGVFDSGVGGLSVWRQIAVQLPDESSVYLADQGHIPYGPRPMQEIRAFSEAIVRFLLGQSCNIVVVACNAASAAALTHLRARFPDVPFVGMEPAVKPAVQTTRTGRVGVMATPATFQGELFASVVERFASGVQLVKQVCPGLVEKVEAGRLDTPDTEAMLHEYLAPMMEAGVDTIVLGCTHYPFLAPAIQRIVGPGVSIIDPSPAIARQVGRVMELRGLLSASRGAGHVFCTSRDEVSFTESVRRLAGVSDPNVHRVRWEGLQVSWDLVEAGRSFKV